MSRPTGADSKELQQDSLADSGKIRQNTQPRRNQEQQVPPTKSAKTAKPTETSATNFGDDRGGYPMSLKAEKGLKQRNRKHCKAQTKAGGACHAPAVEAGLCFFHANPEKLAELGRQGGQKNRRWLLDGGSLPHRSLKSINEVAGLLEETINRVRQGPFDLGQKPLPTKMATRKPSAMTWATALPLSLFPTALRRKSCRRVLEFQPSASWAGEKGRKHLFDVRGLLLAASLEIQAKALLLAWLSI